jgi:hypothetical protein
MKSAYKMLVVNPRESDQLEDLGIDWWIISERALEV